MKQIKTFSDNRLDYYCCYCGNAPDSRDHVPSRILLDEPYPENLPVVPSCSKCNNSLSLDEEYFACLIECILCGTTNIQSLKREKIKRILSRKKTLHQRLTNAMRLFDEKTYFQTEESRVKNVILKLAKGHARYENSESQLESPISYWIKPILTMSKEEKDYFYRSHKQTFLPELGSRAMQRVVMINELDTNSYWIKVQPDKYSYSISHELGGIAVRIVIWEYLACEVVFG